MPLRARVEEVDGSCGALAGNLDARHLIADLERKVEAGGGLVCAFGNGELGFAEWLAAPRERFDDARARAVRGAQHARGELAAIPGRLPKSKRSVLLLRTQNREASGRARKFAQSGREGIALAIVQAIREPDHAEAGFAGKLLVESRDRKSTRLNSSHMSISYAVFCLKKKK